MRTVYCFGNPEVNCDRIALQLAEVLTVPGFSLVKCYKPEQMGDERRPVIIDVVHGLQDISLIDDLEKLSHFKLVTAHDIDLGFWLKLKLRLGMLDKVTIIGIPPGTDAYGAAEKLKNMLPKLQFD